VGGLCGLASVVCYLAAALSPLHDATHAFPIEASRPTIVFAWWTATLWSPLAIVMLYALSRLLARERDGAVNQLAFIFGVIGFATVALLATVQLGGQLWVSDLAVQAPASELETWRDTARALRGVDLGIDLAWDLFLGLWMLLTGLLMLGHSRLGRWWGIPAIVLAVLLLVLNGITVPFPPDTEGLIDLGPVVGLFYAALSGYLLKLGLERRRVPPGRTAPAAAT
jgi:hypothetical protein